MDDVKTLADRRITPPLLQAIRSL